MADVIASSVVGKLVEYTISPVLRQIKYLFFYNSNIQNLRNKDQELENNRNKVERQVVTDKRNNKIIEEEVLAWFPKVDDLKKRVDEVLKGVAGSEMRCLFNRCPNLKSRYLLSRRATKLTIEADNLGTFDRVSYSRSPVQELNLTSHMVFETRLSTKKKIKEALKDKDISIIGICGMPGVGKTTMAKEIVKEVKEEKLFEEVAYAVVSNDPNINQIQDQLAEMLGLKFEEMTNEVRARRLHQRLQVNVSKSILVVLDDVWKKIDLETVGIPSPHDRDGLKIMFTTRIEEMCCKMEAQKKFEIKVLDENEGWQLFKDTAGISDDETEVELLSIARQVEYECRCLPLALVVVGTAMKNKCIREWRDALQQLKKPNVTNLEGHDSMYFRIELSYKQLKSDEDRDLLMLCSLFAEDESIPIENLVKYARGLNLFPNTDTLEETRNRAYSIARNLKSYYLLQTGRTVDEVKLHDVIRDFCLWKAKEDKRGYLVKHAGGLIEWPEHDAHESYSAISITFDELGQLPSGLKYQNVKLLRLVCRDFEECIISEEFFKDMKDLRVLELQGMYIQVPSSIQLLTGLKTLCLINCNIHSQLSMTGSLKKLEILSFYQSFYNYSPIEFMNLCNLRSLDLRSNRNYCLPRLGVLSGMKKLEELFLGCIRKGREDEMCIIEELNSLTSLHTFQISTHNSILMQILKGRCLENLDKFQILGTASRLPLFNATFTRSLILEDGIDASMLLLPVFNSLIKRTYHLHIKGAKVLKNVVSELDGDGFINLETPDLSRGDFEYLIDATNSIPNVTFRKLESLELDNLPKLIEICNGNLPRGVIKPQLFCNLVRVEINCCDTIRSLFRESVANNLVNLQMLIIHKCPMLEEVVSTDARENEVTETCKMLEFPKLKEVRLIHLSRFKGITYQSNHGVVHQTLFNQVTFPNMEELNVSGLDCIVKLLSKEMPITSLHKLEYMDVS